MKKSNMFLITSLCGISLLTAGCTKCPTDTHMPPHEQQFKQHHHKNKHQKPEPKVFQQKYSSSDIHNVKANIYTKSARGGQSEMGIIKFKETDDGLKMWVDLIDLRPGKIYTTQVYQCGACNDNTCCAVEAMSIDLPQLKVNNAGERLQESYIIRGLTATQLNNAKIVLTRDGGYTAAWGILSD
jgi:hypothetical protein